MKRDNLVQGSCPGSHRSTVCSSVHLIKHMVCKHNASSRPNGYYIRLMRYSHNLSFYKFKLITCHSKSSKHNEILKICNKVKTHPWFATTKICIRDFKTATTATPHSPPITLYMGITLSHMVIRIMIYNQRNSKVHLLHPTIKKVTKVQNVYQRKMRTTIIKHAIKRIVLQIGRAHV